MGDFPLSNLYLNKHKLPFSQHATMVMLEGTSQYQKHPLPIIVGDIPRKENNIHKITKKWTPTDHRINWRQNHDFSPFARLHGQHHGACHWPYLPWWWLPSPHHAPPSTSPRMTWGWPPWHWIIFGGGSKNLCSLLTGAKRREWMGRWGLLWWLLLVIMDHSLIPY